MNDYSNTLPGKPKLPFLWTKDLNLAFLNRIPVKYQVGRRARARAKSNPNAPGGVDITSLQTSFNMWDGIRDVQKHNFQLKDLQYVFMAFLILFSLYIAPSAPALKTFAVLSGSWILLMPATRQFFLPGLAIWTWLIYFFCSRFIPTEYRPHIWVRVLPALENVLYGANLSNILSAHKHGVLDILAWLPYGILHFGAPAVCSLIMFIFAAPGTAPIFAMCFGWMNIIGVTIQLVCPCTPPWYENEHGLVPAAYGMPGSPAGLARVDQIFGIDLYTTNFTNAPLPFGAFPSLHSANAVLEALFMSHCFPQFKVGFAIYAGWVWWATMYLSHHYAIDLVGGALLAAAIFYTARARWIPRRQSDKLTRWEYDYVEIGDRYVTHDDEELGQYFSVGLLGHHSRSNSSDSWTLGGSSSSCSSSSGSLSPTIMEDATPGSFSGDVHGSSHYGDVGVPTRDVELSEVVVTR